MSDPDSYEARETSEGWIVRNTTKGQNLLGVYSEEAARRMARRLSNPIKLTRENERLLKSIAYSPNGYDDAAFEIEPATVKTIRRLIADELIERRDDKRLYATARSLEWLGVPTKEA